MITALLILALVATVVLQGFIARFRHRRVETYREVKRQSRPELIAVVAPTLKKNSSSSLSLH
jgi:heme/copper-type cytochrome/quinol oxidase subunit 2